MKDRVRMGMGSRAAFLLVIVCAAVQKVPAQQVAVAAVLQKIDAAVHARVDGIEGYTATEHYAVFRNKDEVHPVAEMTVKTTYKRETGKSYQILSESGSTLIRSMILRAILDTEKHVNQPGVREGAWITTANYQMAVKPVGIQNVNGRDCLAVSLAPRRKEPYLLDGTMWVDARDGGIVRIEGKGSKSSSVFAGETLMRREYTNVDGFAEAMHARAEADSFLFGPTVVKIDYRDYQIQRR